MIIATITTAGFIMISLFGAAVLMAIGVLVIIRQHRNKRESDFKKRHGINF